MMHSWSPDTLIGFSGSFWGASALHAAIRLDFFTPLQHGPLSIQDLARETGCSLRGLEMLAASMCALNFCIRQEDRISLTPFAAQYLCKNSPDYLGFIINHHADLVHSFADLSDAIKTNQPSRSHDGFRTDIRERESFIMGMYNMAYIRAEAAVQLVSLQGSKRLLDLGGGPGAYAIRFCQKNPELSAVVYDLPTTRPIAEKMIRQHQLQDRIDFVAGDFTRDTIPGKYNIVWISHILHSDGPEGNIALLRKAAETLLPGGKLFIQEFVLDDDRSGPTFSALFGLNMVAGTQAGQVYTFNELEDLLKQAGLVSIQRFPRYDDGGSGIVLGQKA